MIRSVLLLFILSVVQCLIPTGFIDNADKQRIKLVLDVASKPGFADVTSAHYILQGYKLLSSKSANPTSDCKYLKENLDSKSIESIYHATEASKALEKCKIEVPSAQTFLNQAIEGATTQTLLFIVTSLKNLNMPVNAKKFTPALAAALKKDDSLSRYNFFKNFIAKDGIDLAKVLTNSLGYAFHTASQLTGDLVAFYDRIEDVVVQADEIDGKYLQFEGGIGVTAMIISGIYRLSETVKKTPPLTNDQVAKFSNYILNRKRSQAIRGLYYLLDSLKILTDNKFHVPVSITLASNVALSEENPIVKVRVTNLLGEPLPGKLTVTADTVTRVKDAAVIMSKEGFTETKADSTLYEVNLMKKQKNLMGTYKIAISAVPKKQDPRFVGNVGSPISVSFLVDAQLHDVEIGTAELDQSASPNFIKVTYPSKVGNQLNADSHQRIILKFSLKNKNSNKPFSSHQVFMQLTNKLTKQEITFVHEYRENGVYKFDVDLKAKAGDFGRLSGVYSIALLIGDRFLSNSIHWTFADVDLKFSSDVPSKKSEDIYARKPEIEHMFRKPEPRPSEFVSNLFTGLIFVPILVLILLWFKIGVNLSNFQFSLSALGFHLSLGGVFALYLVFWLRLNMFITIKYMLGLGIVLFLCGNSLLSSLAKKKK
ncbi:Dolichyl-diphosphooligosaccharide--protein glycosyltransferase subunit 2 [Nymphon striatum]|nr:Dolichyl-diphosphooligosaccharide--protein glycosyltransferase subunit 2 [Nymphon striatum]